MITHRNTLLFLNQFNNKRFDFYVDIEIIQLMGCDKYFYILINNIANFNVYILSSYTYHVSINQWAIQKIYPRHDYIIQFLYVILIVAHHYYKFLFN